MVDRKLLSVPPGPESERMDSDPTSPWDCVALGPAVAVSLLLPRECELSPSDTPLLAPALSIGRPGDARSSVTFHVSFKCVASRYSLRRP
jgi:hypothetical protein